MSLRTSARRVRAIITMICAVAVAMAGALPADAAQGKSRTTDTGKARTYVVDGGPCTIDALPKGASHQWTRTGESIVHRVQYGEGLQQIAYKYGFRGDAAFHRLWDANPQLSETWLDRPGITIRVPACGTTMRKRKLPKPPPPPEPAPEEVAAPTTTSDTSGGKRSAASGGSGGKSASAAPAPAAAPTVPSGSVWDALAQCEAGGNWSINTGNGYYGGLQFSASSWAAVGGTGLPHQHSREEQIKRGEMLKSAQGWGAWPACSAKLGLR